MSDRRLTTPSRGCHLIRWNRIQTTAYSRLESRPEPHIQESKMPFFFFDPTMILLLPAMIFALWAQWKVQHTYQKYAQIPAANGMTGNIQDQAKCGRW